MSDRSIEATVRLSYAGLQNDVNAVNDIIKSVTTNLESLGKTNATNGLKNFMRVLDESIEKLRKFTNLSKESQSFNSFANGLNKTATAMKTLDSVTDLTDASLEKLDTVLDKISQSVIKTYEGIRKLGTEENSVIPNFERFSKILDDLSNKMKYIENHFGKTSSSMKNLDTEVGNSKTQFQQLNNQLNTTNTRLASIDSSSNKTAKSLGYLGTSFRNTFSQYVSRAVNSIEQAITETYKAKSEMQSWFEVMGMSSTQIDSFNKKLDETVQQFRRVNKYGMGETIASLGVEFALTEAEMEKAMKTTAMVTNEYLRAGRTSSEANLAIKDILQGQFQRLSRETGVGEKDLIEAGWSGDNTDVMGILNALEKIATSRHWDTIAQKATSINDVWTIFLNKVSVGTSDLIDRFTPALVGVFNAFMDIFNYIDPIMNGILDWLGGDGITQSIIKWSGLAVSIGSVTTALVHYRTGANLSQIIQMGLKDSIISTIFGLDAETVALYGSNNAIKSKILGLKAEKVAEIGIKDAILTKIIGLKAETVAEKGLISTLKESIATKKLDEITSKAQELISRNKSIAFVGEATAVELVKDKETGSIVVKEAYTIASGEQTGASLGFVGALKLMILGETEAEVTTVGLSGAIGLLTAEMLMNPITWFAGALIALAGAFYVATGGLSDHWEKMKLFNDTMDNSDEIVQQHADYLKNLADTVGETSQKYILAKQSIDEFNDDLGHSKALVKKYKDEVANIDINIETSSKSNLQNMGFTPDQISDLSERLDSLNEGYNTYYRALQVIHKQEDDYSKAQRTMAHNMDERNASADEVIEKTDQMAEHWDNFIKHSAEHNTSDDWWSGSWAGFLAWVDSVQIWLDYKTEDLANWWHDFSTWYEGIPKFLEDTWNGLDPWFTGGLGDLSNNFDNWINDVGKSFSDSWNDLVEMWDNNIKKPLEDLWNGFWSFDWLFGETVSASDGSSDHPSFMEDLSAILGFNVQTWIDSFTSDPLGTIGVEPIDIAQILFPQLFGLVEEGTGIATWVDTSIIQPLKNGISQGIASIPILGDIASMLGLVPQQNQNAYITGYNLIDWLKQGVDQKISEIPIISDIARMLGLIPQQNQNAHDKGHGVGDNIKRGEQEGHDGTAKNVGDEMWDIVNKLNDSGLLANVYNSAKAIGQQIWDGVNSVLQRASPGFIHDQVALEFGVDIPNAISESGATAFSVAQEYASQMYGGMNSVNSDFSLGGVVDDYQNDAQIVSEYSQMMGLDTTTAFNSMVLAVNTSTTQMQSDVTTSYDAMQVKQNTLLNNMKTSNTTAYQQMVTQSNTSLNQMRDSTSNVTQQMTNAWIQMKDSIVVTANNLRSETTSHFDALSSNIGSFYRKIQNPSNWGAGSKSLVQKSARPSAGRTISKAFHGAGSRGRKYNGSSTMTVSQLKRNLCPNGDCGSLFDGYDLTDVVDVEAFLRNVEGEHGFGGWSGWNGTHYQYIRNKSNEWDMKSPQIDLVGGIPTSAQFKVGEFETGTPTISFGSFQSMAESIFSAIPYRYYYDSSWKGSWLGALQAGACNCSDGADALIAFARTCGFDGYKKWGTWDGEGHFWAVINGKPMDTTAWQKGYGWTSPKVSGYGTSGRSGSSNANNYNGDLNLTINIYGDEVEVDENKVDITTAETIIDLVGINPSTGV